MTINIFTAMWTLHLSLGYLCNYFLSSSSGSQIKVSQADDLAYCSFSFLVILISALSCCIQCSSLQECLGILTWMFSHFLCHIHIQWFGFEAVFLHLPHISLHTCMGGILFMWFFESCMQIFWSGFCEHAQSQNTALKFDDTKF